MNYLKECFIIKTQTFEVKFFLISVDLDDEEDAKDNIKESMELILNFKHNKKCIDLIAFATQIVDNKYKVTSIKSILTGNLKNKRLTLHYRCSTPVVSKMLKRR